MRDRTKQTRFGGVDEDAEEYDPSDDPLFRDIEGGTEIFANKKLLTIRHVPGEDRIVGRDKQIEALATEIGPVVKGDPPNNVLIYGKTGTGKSLVSRYVARRTQRAAEARDIDFGYAYIDCSTDDSETQALITLADELNNEEVTGVSIPYNGLGRSNYYRRLWEILDIRYDVVIAILDEVDKLPDDDILMNLSRAEESQKTTCNIGIIAISNKIEFRDQLDERVKSSLSEEEFVFHPYDAGQLQNIMRYRQDAFAEGVLESDAIPLCSALAAQEHGDARKAIDILRNAGELAKRSGDVTVGEEHVRAAKEKAEIDQFKELVKGVPTQVKAILFALASLTKTGSKNSFTTTEVHDRYEKICETIDMDVLTHQRIYELLNEQRFLGVTKVDKTSRGRGEGVTLNHELRKDYQIVRKAILEDSRFSEFRGR